jgi:hypothetical protein
MMTTPEPPTQKPVQRDFSTDEGRLYLYYDWMQLRMDEGSIIADNPYTEEERQAFLTNWLKWIIAEKYFDPHSRLPPYEKLAALPFYLREKDIAQVIRQLRTEKLLPPRKKRKDKGQPQWNDRDEYVWWYIGHMRALQFDQLRRLLARESDDETKSKLLSISRTTRIKDRWVQEKLAIYRPVFHHASGWIHLTQKGLRQAGLDFRPEAPSVRLLHHLYWITEVRMQLEEECEEMEWISERSIQAEQEQRQKGQKLKHIPDGRLVLPTVDGKKEYIDIEVQVSKPSRHEVQQVMSDQFWTHSWNIPLRYYVNRRSQGVVRSVYDTMVKEQKAMRVQIEIIDLEDWLHPHGTPPPT